MAGNAWATRGTTHPHTETERERARRGVLQWAASGSGPGAAGGRVRVHRMTSGCRQWRRRRKMAGQRRWASGRKKPEAALFSAEAGVCFGCEAPGGRCRSLRELQRSAFFPFLFFSAGKNKKKGKGCGLSGERTQRASGSFAALSAAVPDLSPGTTYIPRPEHVEGQRAEVSSWNTVSESVRRCVVCLRPPLSGGGMAQSNGPDLGPGYLLL